MSKHSFPFERIPLDLIMTDRRAWPRHALDQARVAEFISLYAEGDPEALPPLEVIALEDGGYLLADGHHRLEALARLWGVSR